VARGWVDEIVEADALMENAMAAARRLASLPIFAFAQTKTQMSQPVVERLERSGAAIDKIAIEIWAAAETLDRVRDYVARTLKKG
jgi:enoyl-CoA hydratase